MGGAVRGLAPLASYVGGNARAPHSERARGTGARSIEWGQICTDVHPGAAEGFRVEPVHSLGRGWAPKPPSEAKPPSRVGDSYHSPPVE